LFDSTDTERHWATFNPQLSIGKARKLGEDGCLFLERLSSNLDTDDVDSLIIYSFVPLQNGRPGLEAVRFGVAASTHGDNDVTVSRQQGIAVYHQELLTIQGIV
jgi:hypothetical protein